MDVHGLPGARMDLRADGMSKGWIAAFCTPRLCSPFHTIVTLNGKGNARLEISLIRTNPKAPNSSMVTIRADGRRVGGFGVVPAPH
jgi:hypothetical protein